MSRAESLYLDLLVRALLNEPGLDAEAAFFYARDAADAGRRPDPAAAWSIGAVAPDYVKELRRDRAGGHYFRGDVRNIGFGYTMIGRDRLENVRHCVTTALDDGIAGDLVECGVWRGGVGILMRGILAARGIEDRTVWMADSFAGLPRPEGRDKLDLSADQRPELVVAQKRVAAHFERFGLLDDRVRFLRGWFKDTLPGAPIGPIAVLRLDGDLYESTMSTLTALYDKVSPGGFVIVDDYTSVRFCKAATDEFRAERGITDEIVPIDWTGVFWRKGQAA
jgi:hypothetical protein